MDITLPYNFTVRPYQRGLYKYFQGGGDRAFIVWHRRSGKDTVSLHILCERAITKAGNYWYMLPKQTQVRKAIWQAINPHTGKRVLDEVIPRRLIRKSREQDMTLELINGSIIYFIGSDSYDSLVGSPPLGLVFSEYALTNPLAWGILSPILRENKGWVIFNTTPRGDNHALTMYDYAKSNGWFTALCTPLDTQIFTPAELEDIRKEYHSLYGQDDGETLYQQEYWCSFAESVVGSYYGSYISAAERDGRILNVPHQPGIGVTTAWDLGVSDSTAIWFFQQVGKEVQVIDYYENNNQGLDHYVRVLQDKPYTYMRHVLPHDIRAKELSSGKSRYSTLENLGLKNMDTLDASAVADGINEVRNILGRCWFDKDKCKQGLDALRSYAKKYDIVKKVFSDTPDHTWASHGSDAFRYLAMGIKDTVKKQAHKIYTVPDYLRRVA